MAAGNIVPSFDEIIQADRQRRKNEALAREIFGRGRKATAATDGSRKSDTGPSLASRVGIAKTSQRSTSNTAKSKPDVEATWNHDLHRINNPKAPRGTLLPRENPMTIQTKKDFLYDAATTKASRNGLFSLVAARGANQEISIRGTASPYVVIGSNFAPGTTAADIESAMVPNGGEMQSCRIITASPTVMAEMVFTEKSSAESVISTFNNKKADGRLLHVYMKVGGPTAIPSLPAARRHAVEPESLSSIHLTRNEPPPSYDSQREQSDRNRRRAEPELQDGSYGFDTKEDQMDVDMDAPPRADRTHSEQPRPDMQRIDRRNDLRDNRYGHPRSGGRGGYYDRDRGGGRPSDDRRLYSDDLYPRPRGGGHR